MNAIAERYERLYGSRAEAAEALARDLMAGDPTRFKAGYTAANAVIAAVEVFGLTEDELVAVALAVGMEVPAK